MNKICTKCGIQKSIKDFYSHATCKDGVRPDCKSCSKKYSTDNLRLYRKKNPNGRRNVLLKSKYGIDINTYNEKLNSQNKSCAICGSTKPGPKGVFSVDHNHKTGNVRGLLCHGCNIGLGAFRDNVENLQLAIRYLNLYG